MKVLQINSVCGFGSTGRIAVDLCRMLEKHADECCVAFGRGNAPRDIQTYKIGTNRDVLVHGGLSRLTDRHGFYSKSVTRKFVVWMKAYDPDVIILHNLHGYYIHVGVLFEALREMDKPVIWTLHDCWPFTGHCVHFEYFGCNKWKEQCKKCGQKRTYPASILIDNSKKNQEDKRYLFNLVQHMNIVTPSLWLANLVTESFLKSYSVFVIPNGIDLNIFRPTDSNLRKVYDINEKRVVLGVANVWSKKKGLDDFVKLSELLGRDYRIVLIGLKKKQLKFTESGMTGLLRTDSVEQLAQWYSLADVYVNATYEDNFPTTNIEALACGTPVITYDTGGSAESITNSCGRIVRQGNVEELAEAIKEYASHEKDKRACVMRAQKYNKDVQFEMYYELIQGLREVCE